MFSNLKSDFWLLVKFDFSHWSKCTKKLPAFNSPNSLWFLFLLEIHLNSYEKKNISDYDEKLNFLFNLSEIIFPPQKCSAPGTPPPTFKTGSEYKLCVFASCINSWHSLHLFHQIQTSLHIIHILRGGLFRWDVGSFPGGLAL